MPRPAGWLGRYAWDGWISGDALPRLWNPPQGRIVTANNQVVSPDALGYPCNDEGDASWRVQRFEELFAAHAWRRDPLGFAGIAQTDGVEPFFAALLPLWAPVLRQAAASGDTPLAESARLLLGWDGTCTPDSAGATLFHAVCVRLLCANLRGEVPDSTLRFIRGYLNDEPLMSWVLTSKALPGWNSEARIADALREAVQRLTRRYGAHTRDWAWRKAAPFVLRHPFGGQRLLAGFLNRGPLPTRGSHNALNKHYLSRTGDDAFPVLMTAALRVNIDLNDLRASTMSVAGGQSGRPGCVHYDDQLPSSWSR